MTLVVETIGDGNSASSIMEQLQESAKQLHAAQRYALEQGELREALAREFSQFKERVAPLLLAKVERLRSVEEREQYLTVLFLDMRGFSRLGDEERKEHLSMLRGLAQPMLQKWNREICEYLGRCYRGVL